MHTNIIRPNIDCIHLLTIVYYTSSIEYTIVTNNNNVFITFIVLTFFFLTFVTFQLYPCVCLFVFFPLK